MCYSAMIEQSVKKCSQRLRATVAIDLFYSLFQQRLKGDKISIDKSMEAQFTRQPQDSKERQICEYIAEWHNAQIALLEKELIKQKDRLCKASALLKKKVTKKSQSEERIATQKISGIELALARHKDREITSESEERIFPHFYITTVCLNERGQRIVIPARYHMRPHNKDKTFDRQFDGCYNARLDGLETVPWWRDSLKKRRGITLVKRFYEHVAVDDYTKNYHLPTTTSHGKNVVICFEPQGVEYMAVPTLWDVWMEEGAAPLYSAALITDVPAPEVAKAGHDRTPIFLREDAIDAWLDPKITDSRLLKEILEMREFPRYSHRILGRIVH